MSEETAQHIEAYLEYNTACNYEYGKVMSHLVEQFGIESFRCPQPPPFWKAPLNATRPTRVRPSTARGKEQIINSDEGNRTKEFDDDDFDKFEKKLG